MATSKTKILPKSPPTNKKTENQYPDLILNDEDLLCDQINSIILEEEEEDSSTPTTPTTTPKKAKPKHGFVSILTSGLGRVSGNLLNKLVSAGMQTPLVKYLLSPSTLRKALNNDPILRETYRIIWNSDPVQNLLTPEALKIVLDSATAKAVITPEFVLSVLNHPLLVQMITPELIRFIVESDIVVDILRLEVVVKMLESGAVDRFLKPEVMHVLAYSTFFTGLMNGDHFVQCLTTPGIRDVMTKDAIGDALACPGAVAVMNQETVGKILGVEGVRNLLANEAFFAHLVQSFELMVKSTKKE